MFINKALKLLALSAILVSKVLAQSNSAQLSPLTRQFLLTQNTKGDKLGRVPNYNYKLINNKWYISGMIQVGRDVNEAGMNALGILTGTKAGSVWTTQIPVDQVAAFVKLPGISYIQLDVPIFPLLDSARRQTHADSVHRGINLPMPITGKNVVMGVIDAGFDYTHPLMYDTTYSQYRVKRIWAQKTTGTPPSGYAYGNEFTDTNAMKTAGYDTAITSHGTHVAGIAAGSGYGSNATNNKYRGFAYESDLVLVGIMPAPGQWIAGGESDIVDGINYIFNYATAAGRPAVVNLSWGSTLGPHDGHSLFSQACDALTGPGKIFVCAAGNNGQDTVHLQKTFTATDTLVSTFVTFSPYLDTSHLETWVDMWGDTAQSFCVNVKLYNGSLAIDSTGFNCLNDTTIVYKLVGSNGDTCYTTITTVTTDYNGKPHAFVSLYSRVHDNICLTTRANSGTVDMWEGYVFPPTGYYGHLKKLGYPFAISGDTKMTVSDIGCTRSALTVGAHTTKTSFTNISGTTLYYSGAVRGRIAPFSSVGPTGDYRIKPDITAPGFALASGVSSFDSSFNPTGDSYSSVVSADTLSGRTYRYAPFAGTSMAAPCASGIVAMLLQISPALTPDSVKVILNKTAITDAFTGVLPLPGTTTWGHGKINAYGAVKYLVQQLSVAGKNIDAMDCILYPNPASSSFTVAFTAQSNSDVSVTITDITGKIVSVENWQVTKGHNNRQFSIQSLRSGNYLVKVATTNGFVVNRLTVE